MHEGYAFRNLSNIYYRFGSLGLNLACEGLLLGIRAEGPTRFPQLSRIVHLGLWKYDLMIKPSFLIMFFHGRMEI
jgi:hypothetical protein